MTSSPPKYGIYSHWLVLYSMFQGECKLIADLTKQNLLRCEILEKNDTGNTNKKVAFFC